MADNIRTKNIDSELERQIKQILEKFEPKNFLGGNLFVRSYNEQDKPKTAKEGTIIFNKTTGLLEYWSNK